MSRDDLDELTGLLELIPVILSDFADLDVADLDGAIDAALERIGSYTAVDRAYLFVVTPDGAHVDNTQEWCAEGIEPHLQDLQGMPLAAIPAMMERFERGETVYIPAVEELGPDHADERAILEPQHIRSLVAVPLNAGGRLTGFVGFDAVRCHRKWSPGARTLLRAVADVIGSGLARREAAHALEHRALHDPLTGLANRTLLTDRLQQASGRQERSGCTVAVLKLDLDRFKLVNDEFGHAAGDQMLIDVARRLEHEVRPGDTVARFGGDEFVIILDDLPDPAAADRLTERLLAAFDEPFTVADQTHRITVSAGLLLPQPDDEPDGIIHDVDTALYQAKDLGRARVEPFDHAVRERSVRRIGLARALQHAQERDELAVVYQPIFPVAGSAPVGMEALLRWQHPTFGAVSPGEFIAIAEDHGTIVELGAFVLDRSLGDLARWRRQGIGDHLTLNVNLSVRQLSDPTLLGTVDELLAVHGVPATKLCLELTESALMQEPDRGRLLLEALRARGVLLAIDDFGTGYSSLAYLRELPVTSLKIDRSFVTGLGTNEADARVVAAIIGLAGELGMSTTAEGVETAAQQRELVQLGCDRIQGFHLARPAPADHVQRLLIASAAVAGEADGRGPVRFPGAGAQTFIPIARSSSRT